MVALITSFVTCNDTNYGTLADVAGKDIISYY